MKRWATAIAIVSAGVLGVSVDADTTIDPTVNSLIMFGINRDNGMLKKFRISNSTSTEIGVCELTGTGTTLTGIDGSALIPGHQCIIAFWPDTDAGTERIVYIDTETAGGAIIGNQLGPGHVTGAVAAHSGVEVDLLGTLGINPNNSTQGEFMCIKTGTTSVDQRTFTRDDLHQQTPVNLTDGTYYYGSASYVRIRPKGPGSQELTVNGSPYSIENNNVYTFLGDMTVRVWNDHVDGNGKAMGKWHITFSDCQVLIQGLDTEKAWAPFAIQNVQAPDDPTVEFVIDGDSVVPSESFAVKYTVLGAAITYSGYYDVPVTARLKAGGSNVDAFGDFGLPVDGNVNDANNPRDFVFPMIFEAGTRIDTLARSWVKKKFSYSGDENNHWNEFMTVDGSASNSQQVIVLRNGSDAPDIESFQNQESANDFVRDYIDPDTGKMVLDENQAIFLFELGTTNLGSEAADFQDVVVLVTLAKDPASFDVAKGNDSVVASRLLKVNHKTGGFYQLMTLDRVYDGLATLDGLVFYGTSGNELYKLDIFAQSETLVGTIPNPNMFGLEFGGLTLMGFSIDNDVLYAMDAMTGDIIGSGANVNMTNLGTITFVPAPLEPGLYPKSYD